MPESALPLYFDLTKQSLKAKIARRPRRNERSPAVSIQGIIISDKQMFESLRINVDYRMMLNSRLLAQG